MSSGFDQLVPKWMKPILIHFILKKTTPSTVKLNDDI